MEPHGVRPRKVFPSRPDDQAGSATPPRHIAVPVNTISRARCNPQIKEDCPPDKGARRSLVVGETGFAFNERQFDQFHLTAAGNLIRDPDQLRKWYVWRRMKAGLRLLSAISAGESRTS